MTLAVTKALTRRRGREPVPAVASAQVAELQRARLLTALVESVEEDGYECLTVNKVIARARVSRKTFYDVFANREDAFLAAFEQATDRLRRAAMEAYADEGDWRSGIRAGLAQLLIFMDEQPGLACLCLVEVLGAGERLLARRAELLGEVAQAIDKGRDASAGKGDPPPLTAEAVVGGTLAILHNRFAREDETLATDLLSALMSTIVLPYLGARAARTEFERSCKELPRDTGPAESGPDADPLKGLNIRVTYRTVRTLMAIGRNPGASNREASEGAGIVDQGQVSKLLNRLARLELIENKGEGQSKGGANAWHLTARGAYFEKAVRPR